MLPLVLTGYAVQLDCRPVILWTLTTQHYYSEATCHEERMANILAIAKLLKTTDLMRRDDKALGRKRGIHL